MANQIRMTPEMMRTRASQYTTQAGNLQDIINAMDRWEGEASRAYAAKFAELRPGFVKAKDLIDEISAALKSTANIVEQTDQNIAGQFRK